MTPEQQQQFDQLKEIVGNIKAGTDPAFIEAVKQYLTTVTVSLSSKTASAHDQAVNEAGSDTYNVLASPDGFVVLGGYNVPFYN